MQALGATAWFSDGFSLVPVGFASLPLDRLIFGNVSRDLQAGRLANHVLCVSLTGAKPHLDEEKAADEPVPTPQPPPGSKKRKFMPLISPQKKRKGSRSRAEETARKYRELLKQALANANTVVSNDPKRVHLHLPCVCFHPGLRRQEGCHTT